MTHKTSEGATDVAPSLIAAEISRLRRYFTALASAGAGSPRVYGEGRSRA